MFLLLTHISLFYSPFPSLSLPYHTLLCPFHSFFFVSVHFLLLQSLLSCSVFRSFLQLSHRIILFLFLPVRTFVTALNIQFNACNVNISCDLLILRLHSFVYFVSLSFSLFHFSLSLSLLSLSLSHSLSLSPTHSFARSHVPPAPFSVVIVFGVCNIP